MNLLILILKLIATGFFCLCLIFYWISTAIIKMFEDFKKENEQEVADTELMKKQREDFLKNNSKNNSKKN
jgi:hypothetical protein